MKTKTGIDNREIRQIREKDFCLFVRVFRVVRG